MKKPYINFLTRFKPGGTKIDLETARHWYNAGIQDACSQLEIDYATAKKLRDTLRSTPSAVEQTAAQSDLADESRWHAELLEAGRGAYAARR